MKIIAQTKLLDKTVRVVLKEDQNIHIEANFRIGTYPDDPNRQDGMWISISNSHVNEGQIVKAIDIMHCYMQIWIDYNLDAPSLISSLRQGKLTQINESRLNAKKVG